MVFELEKRNSSYELKAFESFRASGFLLARQNYQENDVIVDLLLDRGLRISALVRGGQKSVKRFGGKLEALKILTLQMRAPRGVVTFDKLFSLEAADVRETFDEYKLNWASLNEGLFYTEFFRDTSPKGELESWVYEAALKVLVAGNHLTMNGIGDWRRLYVWTYFAKQMGFGVLGEKGMLSQYLGNKSEEWRLIFEESLFSQKTVELLNDLEGLLLEKKLIRDVYSDWIQRSHLKCKSIESWAMT